MAKIDVSELYANRTFVARRLTATALILACIAVLAVVILYPLVFLGYTHTNLRAGATGPSGPQGFQGDQGPTGPSGAAGNPGPPVYGLSASLSQLQQGQVLLGPSTVNQVPFSVVFATPYPTANGQNQAVMQCNVLFPAGSSIPSTSFATTVTPTFSADLTSTVGFTGWVSCSMPGPGRSPGWPENAVLQWFSTIVLPAT